MATVTSSVFNALEKFSDGDGTALTAFLSDFDRCCALANKVDADGGVPVKGHLLMIYTAGRAKACLEEYVFTQGNVQQTYVNLVAKLKECFDSTSAREISNRLFETRVQNVNESEE